MKANNKFLYIFLAVIVFSTALVSCSEELLDDINKNRDNPKDVQAKFILADVLTSTAFNNVGGDLNTYLSTYVEHEVGVHNQMFYAETRAVQPTASSTFNNNWGSIYTVLRNAKIIIEKCSEGGSQEGNYITRGIAEVMAAYNLALLTDMFGDVPWTEACDVNNKTPKIDKQKDIYDQVFEYLDAAIADLALDDEHASGPSDSHDFIYGGDAEAWTKFAYGLKARYTMRLINVTDDKDAAYQDVLDFADLSFASAAEQAAYAMYDGSDNINPLFDFQYSRDGLGSSTSMIDKLVERNDPRVDRLYYMPYDENVTPSDEGWLPAPNGTPVQQQYYYNVSAFVFAYTAPTLLLSYHELLFLKAEALCRLGGATNIADAKVILKDAVVAGIANAEIAINSAFESGQIYPSSAPEITGTVAATFFDTEISPLFDANPLQETMIQKYIAFYGASGETTETYNDIRRLQALDEDFIQLDNPNNATKFPLRLPYGADDTMNNPNVQAIFGDGTYVYDEPVWWAGGTR